jgi:Aminoglycoside adenylyltransferase, C-terminal domain
VTIPAELAPYLDELLEQATAVVDLEAAYVIGSAASGAFEPGRSDLDVYAVTGEPLEDAAKRELVERIEALDCPARKLEFVVYSSEEAAAANPRFELNLNTGEHVAFTPDTGLPQEWSCWYVLDRAAAEQRAVPLVGPPWADVFAPVTRELVLEAIEESLDWQEQHDPTGLSSVLNAARSWHWLESGAWISKPDAARWLRNRVRAALEDARAA